MEMLTGSKFKFFFPNARVLSDAEVSQLPGDKKNTEARGHHGLWLEIECPEGTCIDDEGRLTLHVAPEVPGKKGIWMKLFCPEDSCEITKPSDLP
ncbi:MAG: hypothetical protein ACOWWM_05635 [Desulfobacterales bacterium]